MPEPTEKEFKALKKLRDAYAQTFGTSAGQIVLEDLKNRFFWYDTTYSSSQGETQLNEGGRKVLLTIENMIALPIEEQKGGER